LALAACFLGIESRSRRPMLPLGLFESSTFSSATAIGFLINVVFYGLIFVLSLYSQHERGYSAIQTGLAFVPATAGVLAANLLAGRAAPGLGARAVDAVGALLVAAALA